MSLKVYFSFNPSQVGCEKEVSIFCTRSFILLYISGSWIRVSLKEERIKSVALISSIRKLIICVLSVYLDIVTNFVMSPPTLPLVKSFIALGLFFIFPIWHEKFLTYLFQPKVLKNLTGFADIWEFSPTSYQVKFKNCKSIKTETATW